VAGAFAKRPEHTDWQETSKRETFQAWPTRFLLTTIYSDSVQIAGKQMIIGGAAEMILLAHHGAAFRADAFHAFCEAADRCSVKKLWPLAT